MMYHVIFCCTLSVNTCMFYYKLKYMIYHCVENLFIWTYTSFCLNLIQYTCTNIYYISNWMSIAGMRWYMWDYDFYLFKKYIWDESTDFSIIPFRRIYYFRISIYNDIKCCRFKAFLKCTFFICNMYYSYGNNFYTQIIQLVCWCTCWFLQV